MTAEPPAGFVDTNVLVYAFDKSGSPKRQIAQRLIDDLMASGQLRLSTQVLQELFVTLTRKVSQRCSTDEALTILDDLTAWPLLIIDYGAIREAARLSGRSKLSFWDALIVIAAALSGASVLYTEDMNDGQEIHGVQIRNPFHGLDPTNR